MTIHYTITPNEVAKSFFKQLRYSSAFRLLILWYFLGIGLAYLMPFIIHRNLHVSDIVIALLIMGITFLILPLAMRLLVKPQQRTLTIDEQGIQTIIGSRNAMMTWSSIIDVVDDTECLFIIRRAGNSFVIPQRAFITTVQRQHFLQAIAHYRSL